MPRLFAILSLLVLLLFGLSFWKDYDREWKKYQRIAGEGGDLAPDLTEVGSRRNADWLFRHFKDPRAINPHSFMPEFRLTDAEARALTEYMLSLK